MTLTEIIKECGKAENDKQVVQILRQVLSNEIDAPDFWMLSMGLELVQYFHNQLEIQLKGGINENALHLQGQGKDKH